jgi:aspartate/methionine/tyrosine aminotransferase
MKSTSTSTQELLQHCIYPRNVRKTVTVNGVAKAFAMTGWRIGYIEEFIAKACTKIPRTSN